jgi:hypothetical protein
MGNQYTFPDGTIIDFANNDPQTVLDAYVKHISKSMTRKPTSIDLELKEKYKRFCRTDEAADNLVQLIQQEVTKARIEATENLLGLLHKHGYMCNKHKFSGGLNLNFDGQVFSPKPKEKKFYRELYVDCSECGVTVAVGEAELLGRVFELTKGGEDAIR